jgi:hypothetical protein
MAAAGTGSRRDPPRRPSPESAGAGVAARVAWLVVAICAASAAAGVVAVQPYAPWWPLLVGLPLLVLAWVRPAWGAAAAIGLLPVADFTDHTGMIFLTESDFVLLAVVAGAALRFGSKPLPVTDPGRPPVGIYVIAMAGVGISGALALAHSLMPLPAFGWEAFSGYSGPLTGLRFAKAFVIAMVLLAVIRACLRADARDAVIALWAGLVASFGLVGLAVFWERLAYIGLTEFAADYRATGPFWEMHVGGAALDGWIAMTLPMAAWGLARSRHVLVSSALAAVAAVGMYALLVTFSRGLYLAAAIQVALLAVWALRSGALGRGRAGLTLGLGVVGLVVAGMLGYVAFGVFATSGYRGLAAFLGVAWLAVAAGPRLAGMSVGTVVGGVALGALVGGSIAFLGPMLPKGPYVLYGSAAVATAAALWLADRRPRPPAQGMALGLLLSTAVAAPAVATHWGGDGATLPAWIATVLAVALVPLCRLPRPPLWGRDPSVLLAGGILLAGIGTTAVLGNSYYANIRFSTAGADLSARTGHWSDSLGLLQSPGEWLLGIGPGRYAERFAWRTKNRFVPGEFRIVPDGTGQHLVLTGPNQAVGWGEIFRVSQRIDGDPRLPLAVEFVTRLPDDVASAVAIHFDVCRKHLLYDDGCVHAAVLLPKGQATQRIVLGGNATLGASRMLGLPRATRFAVGLDSVGGRAEILSLRLTDADGRELLRNGDFRDGTQWWFFSSDRSHLAYHAKNLWLQVFLEQGFPGLIAIVVAGVLALSWLGVGPGSRHPLAPPIAIGLVGFGVVATFDSVVDAPRLATLCLLMMGIALSLRAPPAGEAGPAAPDLVEATSARRS